MIGFCSVEGCEAKHYARGFCHRCYERGRLQRDPEYRSKKNMASRRRHRELRIQVIAALGGTVCNDCGATERPTKNGRSYLEVDHVNGGGREHRESTNYLKILRDVLAHPTEFQILCKPCNIAKAANAPR
jgi:hypothetical protein